MTAQWTDLGEEPVEVGMLVEMVTRKMRNDGDERGIMYMGINLGPQLLHNGFSPTNRPGR